MRIASSHGGSQPEFKNESNADGTKTYSVIAVVNQGRLIGIIDDLKQENTDQKNGTYRRQRECRWHECFEKGIIIPASRDNSDKLFIKVEDHESLKIIFRNFFNLFFEDIDQAEQFIDFQKNILDEAVGVNKKRHTFVEKYRESFQTISKEEELVAGYKGSFCTALINELNGTDDDPVSLHNEDLDDDYEKALSQSDLMESPAHYEYGDIVPREKSTEIIKEKTASDNHRDTKVAQNALAHANYLCEIDPTHETFLRRNSDRTYTESHHLIPMKYSDQFEYSLDTEVNIVSLCSHCHNLIHYGQNADSLIRILYKERKEYLEKAGIGVSESELLSLYGY